MRERDGKEVVFAIVGEGEMPEKWHVWPCSCFSGCFFWGRLFLFVFRSSYRYVGKKVGKTVPQVTLEE